MIFKSLLPKLTLASFRKYFLVLLVSLLLFGGGYYFGVQGYRVSIKKFPKVNIVREMPPDKTDLDFSLFWQVWDTLTSQYYDKTKIIPANMVYGAIKGMVAAVEDPYTTFLPPSENKIVQEDLSGQFEGVGIQIGFKGKQLVVIAPLPNSPAEKAGVKPGDYIINIKDEGRNIDRATAGITLTEAVQLIRGKAGTKVTLTLLRDEDTEPMIKELIREKLEVPTLILSYIGERGEIAHIKLLKFGGETNGEWGKAVREILKKREIKAIILDLRNNPGGYLQGAVDVASEFLKIGSVVVIEEKYDGSKKEFKVERQGLLNNIPVVVLINEGSASASEILAGALRDIRKIKLIGQKTFGKGTIQEPIQLEGGSGLHITIARWLNPSGFWVNEKGLEPDIEIADDPKTPADEQLDKAIEVTQSL